MKVQDAEVCGGGGHGEEGSGQLRKAVVVLLKGWILPCRCRVDLPVCQQGVKAQACFRKMTPGPHVMYG